MSFATKGHGIGEIDINLTKIGVPSSSWGELVRKVSNKRQLRDVKIEDGWLHAKADLGHLSEAKRTAVLKKLHGEVQAKAISLVQRVNA